MPILARRNTLVILLIFTTFIKGLVWIYSVPIWHTPDEAAHFAQVQYFAEKGVMPKGNVLDRSKELHESEILLDVERGKLGMNRYTYHPEYNLEYTNTLFGKFEKEIQSYPISYRSEMVLKDSSRYPPLYYYLSGMVYRLFNNGDLFVRTFAIRIFSSILFVMQVFISYKAGKKIFNKNLMAVTLAFLISFQPMINFVASGVTSDNLGNLLFAVFLYWSLNIIQGGSIVKNSAIMGIICGLNFLTKPQAVILVPLIILAFLIGFIRHNPLKKWKTQLVSVIAFAIFATIFGGFIPLKEIYDNWKESNIILPYVETSQVIAPNITALEFIKFTLNHTVREVLPWYWGVFKWLGVVLPRIVNRIILRLMLIAILGFGIYLVKNVILTIKTRKISDNFIYVNFFLFSAILFFAALTWWDFGHYKTHGFSLGIQGRYFFPLILAHMTILLTGIVSFAEFIEKLLKIKRFDLRALFCKALIILMVSLNFIAIETVISSYYSTKNISDFIIQSSQYKPLFLKGANFLFIFAAYILLLLITLIKALKLKSEKL